MKEIAEGTYNTKHAELAAEAARLYYTTVDTDKQIHKHEQRQTRIIA